MAAVTLWPSLVYTMAQPGDVLLQPTSGRRLIFRRTAAQTGGRVVECAVYYRACEPRPVEHAHADQEHQLEVLEGGLEISLCGRRQRLEPGDVLLVPTGQSHAIWNASEAPAHAVWHTFPAGNTEAYLETEWLREPVRS
jgi:quercetin dioxygenase-like cupin family protein